MSKNAYFFGLALAFANGGVVFGAFVVAWRLAELRDRLESPDDKLTLLVAIVAMYGASIYYIDDCLDKMCDRAIATMRKRGTP